MRPYKDLVLETSTTGGTGALVLLGPPIGGYVRFSSVFGVGVSFTYSIRELAFGLNEVGVGHLDSAGHLVRDSVQSNSFGTTNFVSFHGTPLFIANVNSATDYLDDFNAKAAIDFANVDPAVFLGFGALAGLAKLDLTNIDNTVFLAKGEAAGLAALDLSNVDPGLFLTFGTAAGLAALDLTNVNLSVFFSKGVAGGLASADLTNVPNQVFFDKATASGIVTVPLAASVADLLKTTQLSPIFSATLGISSLPFLGVYPDLTVAFKPGPLANDFIFAGQAAYELLTTPASPFVGLDQAGNQITILAPGNAWNITTISTYNLVRFSADGEGHPRPYFERTNSTISPATVMFDAGGPVETHYIDGESTSIGSGIHDEFSDGPGVITAALGSPNISGIGALFTQLIPGTLIMRGSDQVVVGILDHAVDDNNAVLRANAAIVMSSAAWSLANVTTPTPLAPYYTFCPATAVPNSATTRWLDFPVQGGNNQLLDVSQIIDSQPIYEIVSPTDQTYGEVGAARLLNWIHRAEAQNLAFGGKLNLHESMSLGKGGHTLAQISKGTDYYTNGIALFNRQAQNWAQQKRRGLVCRYRHLITGINDGIGGTPYATFVAQQKQFLLDQQTDYQAAMVTNFGSYGLFNPAGLPPMRIIATQCDAPLGGSYLNINNITQAANAVVTTNIPHLFTNGQRCHIRGVNGMTQVNDLDFVVGNVTTFTFTIGVNSTGYTPYAGPNVGKVTPNYNFTTPLAQLAMSQPLSPDYTPGYYLASNNCALRHVNGDHYLSASYDLQGEYLGQCEMAVRAGKWGGITQIVSAVRTGQQLDLTFSTPFGDPITLDTIFMPPAPNYGLNWIPNDNSSIATSTITSVTQISDFVLRLALAANVGGNISNAWFGPGNHNIGDPSGAWTNIRDTSMAYTSAGVTPFLWNWAATQSLTVA